MKILLYILIILLFHSPVSAEQDCEVMDYETDNFTIGFKAGGIFWGVGPEVTWGSSNGVVWNNTLQYTVAEYKELCARFNTGRMTKEEYKREINLIIERSRNYALKLARLLKEKKQSMFNEMKEYEK